MPKPGHQVKIIGNFNQVNLVANNNKYNAAHIDPLLLNAWGIAFSPTGTPWIGALGGHVSTIYNSEGVIQAISPVTIPSPGGPQPAVIRLELFLTAAIQILYCPTDKQPGLFLLVWMASFRVGMAPQVKQVY